MLAVSVATHPFATLCDRGPFYGFKTEHVMIVMQRLVYKLVYYCYVHSMQTFFFSSFVHSSLTVAVWCPKDKPSEIITREHFSEETAFPLTREVSTEQREGHIRAFQSATRAQTCHSRVDRKTHD